MANLEYFHGTSKKIADELVSGKIDVTLGGGELGQGFYTGEYLWVAKAWAHNRHRQESAVVKAEIDENTFFSLEPLLLTRLDALKISKDIKANGATRTQPLIVMLFGHQSLAQPGWTPINTNSKPSNQRRCLMVQLFQGVSFNGGS